MRLVDTDQTSRDLKLSWYDPNRTLVGADSTPLNAIGESLVELCNKGLVIPALASILVRYCSDLWSEFIGRSEIYST